MYAVCRGTPHVPSTSGHFFFPFCLTFGLHKRQSGVSIENVDVRPPSISFCDAVAWRLCCLTAVMPRYHSFQASLLQPFSSCTSFRIVCYNAIDPVARSTAAHRKAGLARMNPLMLGWELPTIMTPTNLLSSSIELMGELAGRLENSSPKRIVHQGGSLA